MSLTPLANLPPVSLIQVANLPQVATKLAKLVAKFAASVVDTGGKFSAGVIDTGGNFAALPPVSLILVVHLTCEYIREFLKKFEMVLMGFSGAGGN